MIIINGDNNSVSAETDSVNVVIYGNNSIVGSGTTDIFIFGSGNTIAENLSGVTIFRNNVTSAASDTVYIPGLDVSSTILTTNLSATSISADSIYATIFSAGSINANSFSASSISATTFYSGSTDLSLLFGQGSGTVSISGGTNIFTGGTNTLPVINLVPSPSVLGLNASGNTYLSATTASTISLLNTGYTSSQMRDWNSNLINTGVTFSNIIGGSGQTINRDLHNVQMLGGTDISGTTSDTTYVGNIVATGTTGGNFYATNFFSGSTNLLNIFSTADLTRVSGGANITTGGTANNPIINLVDSPSINGLTFSGTARGSVLSATTLSAGTIYSANTNLYSIFLQTAYSGGASTFVQNGSNIITGGTASSPTVNLVPSPSLNGFSFSGIASGATFSATTLSAGTIYSASTDLYKIFLQTAYSGGTSTFVQNGSNITTGGTASSPTVNLVPSPSIFGLTASGTSNFTGTLSSGGTNLYSIFLQTAYSGTGGGLTLVQPGSNISTGGTSALPIVNLTDNISINNVTVSGNTYLGSLIISGQSLVLMNSAATSTTLSDTNSNLINVGVSLSNIFGGSGNTINGNLTNVQMVGVKDKIASVSDMFFTSNINALTITATTLSASTSIFGNTNSTTLSATTLSAITSIFGDVKSINLTASTFTAITISAVTLSASTIFSGTSNIETVFLLKTGTNRITVGTTQPTSPNTGDLWVDTN